MAKLLKLRRGTTSQHASFTGAEGEVTIDTTKDTAVVHDGAQAGGRPLAREDMTNVSSSSIAGQLGTDSIATTKIAGGALPTDVTVTNANVVSDAAIAGTKISPDFGSQNVTTTGNVGIGTGSGTSFPLHVVSNNNTTVLKLESTDADANVGPILELFRNSGTPADNDALGRIDFRADDAANNESTFARIGVTALDVTNATEDAKIEFTAVANDQFNPSFTITGAGADVTGNITVTGTVDGRDVAADGSKLDGIDSGAKDDQTKAEIDALNINADQVDGLEASQFLRSDADDSASGSYSFTNSYNEFGDSTGSVSNDGGWHARVNIAGSNHGRLDVKSVSDGIIATMSAHNGHGKAYMGTRSSGHSLGLYSGGSEGATLSTSGSLSTTVQGTLWGASNDGSGSGLDADLLDGVQAGGFLRADTADQADADITFAGGAGGITISGGTDIRLGNSNTSWTGDYGAKIQHYGTNLYLQYGSGSFIVRNPSGSNQFTVDGSGNAVAAGNVTAYSDAKLKTDISTINDALGICGKLRGVSYKWLKDGSAGIGVIAQEVEQVLPEVVVTTMDPDPVTGESTEVKSVDYGKIVGVLINAINELKAEVDELKGGK